MKKPYLKILAVVLAMSSSILGKVYTSTSEYLKDNDPDKYKEFVEDSIRQANCPRIGITLLEISKRETISDSLIASTVALMKENEDFGCFVDDIVIQKDSAKPIFQGLTYTVGKICEIANSKNAFRLYLEYVRANYNSAEEEISFALERLFMKNPALLMKEIDTYPEADKNQFFQDLIWGFINNRYYGPEGPFVDLDQKAFMEGGKRKPVLNAKNYDSIFFEINPELKAIAQEYPDEFSKILNGIKNHLERQE